MASRHALVFLLSLLALTGRPASAANGVVLGAGDIAGTGTGDNLTANLLAANPSAIVLTLGDNAYNDGTLSQFNDRYHPSWGAHVARTFPSVGNHDYNTAGGAGYDAYFRPKGRPIGVLGKHWYSFDYGGWHFVALNSNCGDVSCDYGGEQAAWLEADLSAHDADCTLAYWHHPRFSSGSSHGSSTATQDLYEILHNHGADVILTGHDHNYERFARQDAFGNADSTGPTQFVVGTGGASLRSMGVDRAELDHERGQCLRRAPPHPLGQVLCVAVPARVRVHVHGLGHRLVRGAGAAAARVRARPRAGLAAPVAGLEVLLPAAAPGSTARRPAHDSRPEASRSRSRAVVTPFAFGSLRASLAASDPPRGGWRPRRTR